MVLTPSSLLCVCRAKLLSAEWFHNSFFQFSLAYDCLELFHTVHVVVCYVVHSFHPQMACATPSQIKKVLNFIPTHRGTHTSGFDQKQNQKAGTTSQLEQNHFFFSPLSFSWNHSFVMVISVSSQNLSACIAQRP